MSDSITFGGGLVGGTLAAAVGTATAQSTPTPGVTRSEAVSTPESDGDASYAIRIRYDGAWQGAASITAGGDATTESISGSGTTTVDITGSPDIVSANAQKQDDSGTRLTVEVLHEGEVVSEASTTAGYGIAQVSESFY